MKRSAFLLLPALLLGGCGDAGTLPGGTDDPASEKIWCALDGAKGFAQDCALERSTSEGQPAFVVRHPDGKFRRLIASADGQNLLAADGADDSQSARKGDAKDERWEVILGEDRYVVPVRADAPQP
jgi:hypothetical protein